ncbi:MAG: hypothetical protein ACI4F7_03290 [Acutalibacteraceae bacterium]
MNCIKLCVGIKVFTELFELLTGYLMKSVILAQFDLLMLNFKLTDSSVQRFGGMDIRILAVKLDLHFNRQRKKISACTAAFAD